jgi:hypothetical protein
MRTIGGFSAKPGTSILLRVLHADDEIMTFGAVLKKFESDGGGTTASWTAAQLKGGGGTATLEAIHGYNVIVLPVSHPDSDPEMEVELTAVGPTQYSDRQTVKVGKNEPFGWRIFLA